MHFIGRAMIAKGWLLPEALPPAASLHVELAGRAREIFFPDTIPADSSAQPPPTAQPVDRDSAGATGGRG